MPSDLVVYATEYLKAGLHLLALEGKRPGALHRDGWSWENSIHGEPEGAEEEAILAEALKPPVTGIAILIPENVYVLDIDSDVAAAIYMNLAAGAIPDTAISKTGKGFHVWFLAPGADQNVWVPDKDGLLLKGLGGYVVAPPSLHPSGATYEWVNPLVQDGRIVGIDWLPDGIAASLRAQLVASEMRAGTKVTGELMREAWHVVVGFDPLTFTRAWNIDGLCKAIIEAADGNQNNVIAWAALTAQEEGVPYSVAMDLLLAAAVKGGHPADRAKTTIKGAYHRRRSAA